MTPEILAMPLQDRLEYIKKHLVVTSDKPFEPGQFDKKSPITSAESAAVTAFFGVMMGGPIAVISAVLYATCRGSWAHLLGALGTSIVLAVHPLPDPAKMTTSKFTIALYKYFSYRWMWVDDVQKQCDALEGWIGAGGPHGVLPVANVLSMPAINAFSEHRFIGAGASVVLYTPFLRYMALLGGACDVSAKSLTRETKKGTCIGIVPDGIAGIFKNKGGPEEIMALKSKKGLAKLSLKTGIPLVPAYSLGNTGVYTPVFDGFGVMEKLSRKLQVSVFLFYGRFGLPIPRRTNICLLLGEPIKPCKVEDNPPQSSVDEMHELLLARITELFDTHKAAVGWGHRTMKFV